MIDEYQLDQGLELLEIMDYCDNCPNCLWERRDKLFKISVFLPDGCQRENCEVVIFRKVFEECSPILYAEALKLSRFNDIIKTNADIADRKKKKRKKVKKLIRRTDNLHVFGQLLVLAFYPLYLETREIPFFRAVEIVKLKANYNKEVIYQTEKTINEMNSQWFKWLISVSSNIVADHKYYLSAIVYLIYLFLKGKEKTQLPDLKNMTESEKNQFFKGLEDMISKRRTA